MKHTFRSSWFLLACPALIGVSNVIATQFWRENLAVINFAEAILLFAWVGVLGVHNARMKERITSGTAEVRSLSERLDTFFRNAQDYVLVLAGGQYVYVSPSWTKQTGTPPEAVVGHRPEEFIHPEDLPKIREDGSSARYRVRTNRGDWRWVEGVRFPLDWEGERGVAVIARDVTEQIQAEADRDAQAMRLQALRKIDVAILRGRGGDQPFSVIVDQVMELLPIDAATLLLIDSESSALRVAAHAGCHVVPPSEALPSLRDSSRREVRRGGRACFAAQCQGKSSDAREAWLRAEGFASYVGVPLDVQGERLGMLEVFTRSPMADRPDWLEYLEAVAGQASIALGAAHLIHDLRGANVRLLEAYDATLEGWVRAVDLRDKETEGHTRRVTTATVEVAERLGITGHDLQQVRRGALLHDIGKIAVPDAVLLKPGQLNDEEWEMMRQHPVYALEWLRHVPFLRPALAIPFYHHERWDGTGYPLGLMGEEIPLPARIFAIVDVWDALRSDRPYRSAWPEDKVFEHLRAGAGTHFDPDLVPLVIETLREIGR